MTLFNHFGRFLKVVRSLNRRVDFHSREVLRRDVSGESLRNSSVAPSLQTQKGCGPNPGAPGCAILPYNPKVTRHAMEVTYANEWNDRRKTLVV
jgi:hypothetical protein